MVLVMTLRSPDFVILSIFQINLLAFTTCMQYAITLGAHTLGIIQHMLNTPTAENGTASTIFGKGYFIIALTCNHVQIQFEISLGQCSDVVCVNLSSPGYGGQDRLDIVLVF